MPFASGSGSRPPFTFTCSACKISFGIDKAVKYHSDMRMYASDFAWVMNKGWYDKLAAGQKKVIDDHCNNEWAAKVGAAWGDSEDAGQAKLEEVVPGHVREARRQYERAVRLPRRLVEELPRTPARCIHDPQFTIHDSRTVISPRAALASQRRNYCQTPKSQ